MVKLLIINADKTVRAVMAECLERYIPAIFVTENIDEAWNIFLKEKPMTCIIDPVGIKESPVMSWRDFIRKGKTTESTSRFWVAVFLNDRLEEEAKTAGADEIVFDVLFEPDKLVDKLLGRT